MGRCASVWAVAILVVLQVLPAAAEPLELHRPLARPPELPERAVFDELLLSFADPDRALAGGFTVPSLSLAVRARAWAFVQPGAREQREAWDVLALSAQDVTLSELPAGTRLGSLMGLGPEAERFRVRDFAPWFRGPNGPLQQTLRPMLQYLPGEEKGAMLMASVVGLGLAYQFGTARAQALGLTPLFQGSMFKGRLRASIQVQTEPHFQNARADVAARIQLPESLRLARIGGKLEQLEVGGSAARNAEGFLLDDRWVHLRGRLSWLELTLGVRAKHDDPPLWMDVETNVRRDCFGLRTVVSYQWETTRTLTTATASLRTGPVLSGLFVGLEGTVKHTFGLVSMGTF